MFSGTPDLGILDTEDGCVLATAFAADTDVLVTDNLVDFAAADCEVFNTSTVQRADGSTRRLSCQNRSPNSQLLVVAHPADFAYWIERGFEISSHSIEATFERQPKPKSTPGKH